MGSDAQRWVGGAKYGSGLLCERREGDRYWNLGERVCGGSRLVEKAWEEDFDGRSD